MEGLPPQLAHVVERCLATEPENRWHSAKDVQFQLEVGTAILSPAMTSPAPRALLAWVAAAGALVLAGGMAIWGWLHTPPAEPRLVTRWTATLPAAPFYGSGLSITRDGTRLAYGELTGSSPRIGVRLLDQFEGRAVPGAEGGHRPFFSPDGQWLAYFTGPLRALTLKKVPVTGGTPIALCEGARFEGGSWGEDNRIIFSGGSSRGLMQVSASGGTCESLTSGDLQKREIHVWPQILPGGRSVLFTIGTPGSFDSARVAVLDLRTRQYRVVVSGGSSARYVPSGHLVYARGGAIFAVPFDLKRLAVTGSETPVVEGVYYNAGGGFADYAFSDSGLLVYMTEPPATNLKTLEWLDRKGTSKVSPAPPADYQSVRLSPDEQRAAVELRGVGRTFDIWILELARGGLTRLTTEGSYFDPLWTRDSTHVVFGFGPPGRRGFHWAPTDGSGKPEMLLERQEGVADSWTPEGKTLLYHSVGPAHIWKSQPAVSGGDGKPRLLFEETSFNERDAQVSPDGRWLAYTSDESGKNRVYVRPFPGPGGKTPISIESGQEPRWSRGGPELFYRDPDKNQLMAVDIQTSPAFRAGQPHALFALGNVPWDVAPNGKRFLVVKEPASSAREAKMQAVVNWFEELRQKAPKK
jgi:Tol biopolymer transport system component